MRNEVFVYLEIYSVYLEIYEYGEVVQGVRFPDESKASANGECGGWSSINFAVSSF